MNEILRPYSISTLESDVALSAIPSIDGPERIIEELDAMGFDLRGKKTLDLGSGYGYFIASLALRGCKTYGIELYPGRVEYCKRHLQKLPVEKTLVPDALSGDYLSDNEFVFGDGTRPADIDFFYCFSYTDDHALAVIAKLSDTLWAKPGSVVCTGRSMDWNKSNLKARANALGFEVFPRVIHPDWWEYFLKRTTLIPDQEERKWTISNWQRLYAK